MKRGRSSYDYSRQGEDVAEKTDAVQRENVLHPFVLISTENKSNCKTLRHTVNNSNLKLYVGANRITYSFSLLGTSADFPGVSFTEWQSHCVSCSA